jgi:SAM-dependent methyltransferase
LAEFTGERVIPGQVDIDLLNEHLARYAFAARLARGKRVLDAGCGAGYGTAELARVALSAAGIDSAADAIDYARANYRLPNLFFTQGSCAALPYVNACFDLIAGFEVIEHLDDWRAFLLEVRRTLAPNGQFIVSTPNKLYYTESRGIEGANPFHVHEFEFEEFHDELLSVFPYVSLYLENHVEGVAFQPNEPGNTVEVRLDSGDPVPNESHFFVAVCAHRPQLGNPAFVYVPRAGNVLRERERHIALLEEEVAKKTAWLERANRDLARLNAEHQKQTEELDRSNRWAEDLNRQIGALQAEVLREQQHSQTVAEGYAAKVAELEQELRAVGADAEHQTAALGRAVEALHRTEKELDERTAWAQRLQEENAALESRAVQLDHHLTLYRTSRWVKLGRKVGLGPTL